MLRREQDNIINMVFQAWSKFEYAAKDDFQKAQKAAQEAYKTDPRVTNLSRALATAGVLNSDGLAWKLVTNTGMISGVGYVSGSSVYADIRDAAAAITPPKTKAWHGSTTMTELTTALGTSKSKWADIQTPFYGLVADLGAVKSQEDIEAAVHRFSTSIV